MKSYTIGREETCSIVIPDSSQMVSRLHATLNVDGGKMTITDSSSNGTYINGIRISSGMPVPVTRKDVVTFAQVAELDWKLIPNSGLRTLWITLATVLVLAAVGCGLWFFLQDSKKKKEQAAADEAAAAQMMTTQIDSLASAVNKICTVYDALVKEVDEVTQACSKKAPAQLTEVSKILGQVEEKMKSIDTAQLRKSLDSVIQSKEDGSEKTGQRVAELQKDVAASQTALDAAKGQLTTAKDLLAKIPDVKPAAKKPAPKEAAAEPEEQPKDKRIF